MDGGAGANIFKYLTVGNSYANYCVDAITNFDPVKDVIDLGSIGPYSGLYTRLAQSELHLHRNGAVQRRRRAGALPVRRRAQRNVC